MKVLVVNCGSSSLKYQLINMETEHVLGKGLIERIGLEGAVLTHQPDGMDKVKIKTAIPDHKVAIKMVLDALVDKKHGVVGNISEIGAVGHRVVHGGEKFIASVKIDENVMKTLDEISDLAPLHNPPNIAGIVACQEAMGNIPHVAVFDTAFHQTIPRKAFLYALPYEMYENDGVRRYGFHGTSHKYVATRAAEILGKNIKDLKIVSCHLGNGASITAIEGGQSIDTSMGFTPLAGLMMGTRCGDIDPAIIKFLMNKEGLSIDELDNMMNKKSGVLGISGVSSDFRDLEEASEKGNTRAQLALDMFEYKVKQFIGSYSAVMNGMDVLIFTAGLGENGISFREKICANLESLGIKLDPVKNNCRGKEQIISNDDSKVTVMVVPTNEELMIAQETKELVGK